MGLWVFKTVLKGKDAGAEKWVNCKRYYQWNTIHNALMYAANEELMDKNEDEALTFQEYADELRRILDGYILDVQASLKEGK